MLQNANHSNKEKADCKIRKIYKIRKYTEYYKVCSFNSIYIGLLSGLKNAYSARPSPLVLRAGNRIFSFPPRAVFCGFKLVTSSSSSLKLLVSRSKSSSSSMLRAAGKDGVTSDNLLIRPSTVSVGACPFCIVFKSKWSIMATICGATCSGTASIGDDRGYTPPPFTVRVREAITIGVGIVNDGDPKAVGATSVGKCVHEPAPDPRPLRTDFPGYVPCKFGEYPFISCPAAMGPVHGLP